MSSTSTPHAQATDRDRTRAVCPNSLPEAERERIRAAARDAADQFPPMSSELVTLVRNTLRGRTR